MKKIAVILSGCGVYDGSEIHEAVLSMLAIEKHGAKYTLFAPDKPQAHVINHLNGEEMKETRNVLIEAARIARGKISKLSELVERDFDALFFPGGYGAAKNLSSFGFEGKNMKVDPEVDEVMNAFYLANKPIGAVCIAPVVLSKSLGNINVTIGNDVGTAGAIEHFGSHHIESTNKDIVIDPQNKIVTGPCYMLDAKISDIEYNTSEVVKAMLELIDA